MDLTMSDSDDDMPLRRRLPSKNGSKLITKPSTNTRPGMDN